VRASTTSTPTTIRLKTHPFFKAVRIEKNKVHAGDHQCLDITVKNSIQEVIVLSATIAYPNGELDNLSVATNTQSGQLHWQVPESTSSGRVAFVVSAGSGGCCGSDTRKRGLGTLASVRGSFEVLDVQGGRACGLD